MLSVDIPRGIGQPAGEPILGVGAFEIDQNAGVLRRDGLEVRLRSQTWRLLLLFASQPRRLLSRTELMTALWPRTVVGNDSLVQCIVELRCALGDADRRLVRTVPRLGYRLDAEVRLVEQGCATSRKPDERLAVAWRRLTAADSLDEVVAARRLFEDGSGETEQRGDAMAGISLSHTIEVLNRWASSPAWSVTLAREAANEALAVDPKNAMACHARAHVAMQEGQSFDALLGFQAALARDPQLARARLRLGVIEMELGHPERTALHVDRALRGERTDDVLCAQAHFIQGMAWFHLGQDAEAAAAMHRVLLLRPGNGFAHQWIAAIDALCGAPRSSEAHLDAFRQRIPGHTLDSLRATERPGAAAFKGQRDRFYEGLRRAGLQ
jgi:DNA-binding winged helix-turn-helix (wHTH) protein